MKDPAKEMLAKISPRSNLFRKRSQFAGAGTGTFADSEDTSAQSACASLCVSIVNRLKKLTGNIFACMQVPGSTWRLDAREAQVDSV
jgi:hypothetical protein